MSMRLPNILGEIRLWQLNDELNTVEGVIYNSTDVTLKDGVKFSTFFKYLTEYPDDYLVRVADGYYMLRKDHEKGHSDDGKTYS